MNTFLIGLLFFYFKECEIGYKSNSNPFYIVVSKCYITF